MHPPGVSTSTADPRPQALSKPEGLYRSASPVLRPSLLPTADR